MKVKDICTLQNGRAFKPEDWGLEGLPIVRIQNLNDENAPFNYYSGEYSQIHEINNGDLLFSWSGTPGTSFGAFRWYRGKGVLNQHIFKVLPKIDVDLDYLKYAFNGNIDSIIAKAHGGVGLQHITKKELDEILPKEKQISVVGILQHAETIIFKRKLQLSSLDDLIKARFVEMFGDPFSNPLNWECISFKESSLRLSDGPFGSNLKSEHYSETGVRVIRLGNIGVGRFIDEDKSFIPPEHYENLKKYTCHAGEIVIGTLGDPNLRACIIPKEIGIAVNKADCVHYIPDPSLLNTEFACQYVNCPETLLLAHGMIHGQTRSRVSSGQIAEMPIFIPPLELQNVFSDFVHQIDKSKFAIQKSLNETPLFYLTA